MKFERAGRARETKGETLAGSWLGHFLPSLSGKPRHRRVNRERVSRVDFSGFQQQREQESRARIIGSRVTSDALESNRRILFFSFLFFCSHGAMNFNDVPVNVFVSHARARVRARVFGKRRERFILLSQPIPRANRGGGREGELIVHVGG